MSNGAALHQQVVQLLIDHGADVNIADQDGQSPLWHARAKGFREIREMLEKAGARQGGAGALF